MQLSPITVSQALSQALDFQESGRTAEAESLYAQVIAVDASQPDAWNNLGNILLGRGERDRAVASFRRALVLQPEYPEAHYNLGNAMVQVGAYDEAERCFRRAIAAEPTFQGAHWNLALTLLRLGKFEEGWKEYEWRKRRQIMGARWDGLPAPGKTILIHCEQGFGDATQFIRYVPLAVQASCGARVVVECHPFLIRLFSESFPGIEFVSDEGAIDQHAHLLSLPFLLRQFEPLRTSPYLRSGSSIDLGGRKKTRIGIAWAGSSTHHEDSRRSIPAEKLAPIFDIPGIEFCNLQIGSQFRHERLIDRTSEIDDFADTAALVSQLDMVITVDTAVAHLAGAMGVEVWTLLPFVSDWRWGITRETTAWYPTMRLVRQDKAGDWDSVISRVVENLNAKFAD